MELTSPTHCSHRISPEWQEYMNERREMERKSQDPWGEGPEQHPSLLPSENNTLNEEIETIYFFQFHIVIISLD